MQRLADIQVIYDCSLCLIEREAPHCNMSAGNEQKILPGS